MPHTVVTRKTNCSCRNTTSSPDKMYDSVMTTKRKKAKRQKSRSKPARVGDLYASLEDDLLSLTDQEKGGESRWNRPRKRRISLRVDVEVVDWFQSKGPGYQTRMNQILRRVMEEGKKRTREK